MADDPVDRALSTMAGMLVADVPLGEALWRIATVVSGAIRPVSAVGVAVLDGRGRPMMPVSTDEVAAALDLMQHDSGEGPSPTASRERRVVRVRDVRSAPRRWRAFAEVAEGVGVLSTMAVPLATKDDAFGVLNLYAPSPNPFTPSDEADVLRVGAQAAVALANARAYWSTSSYAADLEQAMTSRAVIEQAKGKVMAVKGCTADEAFEVLKRASQRENLKVREVARRMVEQPGPVRAT